MRTRHSEDYRDMLRRAVDSLSAIGEDVSPEVLNKLKAMETSSRQVGNIAEADAFLNKVRQYEPSYKPGSHDYGTYGPTAARTHGQPQAEQSPAQAARNKAWQDFVRSRYSNRRYQQSYQKYNQATGESGGRTRGKAKPKASTSSSSSSTGSAPSSKPPVDRKAAAKKAWETMRAKRSAAAGKAADMKVEGGSVSYDPYRSMYRALPDGSTSGLIGKTVKERWFETEKEARQYLTAGKAADSTDLRGRMHRALDRILDWHRSLAAGNCVR